MRTEYHVWVNKTWVSTADLPQAAIDHATDSLNVEWDGESEISITIYPTEVEDLEAR